MAAIRQSAFNYTAASSGPWIYTDTWSGVYNSWYLVSEDTGASLTLQLDIIADDASNAMAHLAVVSQSGTTITVQDSGPPLGTGYGQGLGHGLAVGDFVSIDDAQGLAGIYSVTSVTSATVYTLTALGSAVIAAHNATIRTGKVFPAYKTITLTSGRAFGQLNPWAWAVRLTASAVSAAGVARLVVGIAPTVG